MRCNLMIEHLKTSIDKHKYAFRPNKRKSALPKRNSIDGDYLLSSEFLIFVLCVMQVMHRLTQIHKFCNPHLEDSVHHIPG